MAPCRQQEFSKYYDNIIAYFSNTILQFFPLYWEMFSLVIMQICREKSSYVRLIEQKNENARSRTQCQKFQNNFFSVFYSVCAELKQCDFWSGMLVHIMFMLVNSYEFMSHRVFYLCFRKPYDLIFTTIRFTDVILYIDTQYVEPKIVC